MKETLFRACYVGNILGVDGTKVTLKIENYATPLQLDFALNDKWATQQVNSVWDQVQIDATATRFYGPNANGDTPGGVYIAERILPADFPALPAHYHEGSTEKEELQLVVAWYAKGIRRRYYGYFARVFDEFKAEGEAKKLLVAVWAPERADTANPLLVRWFDFDPTKTDEVNFNNTTINKKGDEGIIFLSSDTAKSLNLRISALGGKDPPGVGEPSTMDPP